MKQESAETIALQALGWIASNDEVLSTFLAASGAGIGDLASNVANPGFLEFVLDFVLSDDVHVLSFCDSIGMAYSVPGQARLSLPGAALINWT